MDIEAIEAKHYRQFVDTFRANVWNNSDFPVSVEIVISLMDWEFDPHALDRYSTIDLKEQAADQCEWNHRWACEDFEMMSAVFSGKGFESFFKEPKKRWIGYTDDNPNAFRITLKLPEWSYLKINNLPKSHNGEVSNSVFKRWSEVPILRYSRLGKPTPWFERHEDPPPYKFLVNNAMVFENSHQELLEFLVGGYGKDAYKEISDSRILDGLTEEGGVEPTDYPKWFKLGKLKAYTVTDSPTLPQPRNIVEKVLAHLSTINRPEPKPFLTAAEYNKDHRTLLDIKRLTMFTFEQNPSISGPWSPGVKNPRSTHGRWN